MIRARLVRSLAGSASLRVLLLLLSLAPLWAAGGAQASAPLDSPALAYLQRLQAESGSPGVSAAVSVGGRVVFSAGVGSADLETGAPQTGTTVHNIGSISKTHAVVAVMQLVEQGKVDLDAQIQRYVPWFPRKGKPITVRQILTHTSGIRHYRRGEFGPGDVMVFRQYDAFEESTRFWRDDPLLFEPGSHWSYSSYATSLMHAIVETVSGQPFESYLTDHVWHPAGMLSTQFDVPSRIVVHRGRGYEYNDELGRLENAVDENVSYKYAGGGIISTDEDLCRFGHALNAGLLLKPATIKEMYRLQLRGDLPRFGSDDSRPPPIGASQALIFRVSPDHQGRLRAQHAGAVKGTQSQFFNYVEDDVVVALHFNAGSGAVVMIDAAEALATLFLPQGAARAGANAGPAARQAAVDAVFADMDRPGVPGAAVGLYQHGELIYSRGYGYADLDHSVPITGRTVFNLASVSKQFTAFSIALLAREGKVDLQADIRTYLPDMPELGTPVTVADLVHHMSGVRDYMALGALSGHDDDSLLRQEQAISLIRQQRSLSFAPGTQYEYSNSGYALLAEIVQAASGQSLRELMHERIFAPLGMTRTRLRDDLSRTQPGYAVGYEPGGEPGRPWARAVYNRITIGPGNVLSTVGDLVKWVGNFANPVVGDRALIEQIAAPTTLRDGTPVNYGFGLGRDVVLGHRVITHDGAISGFNATLAFFPDDDFGIVILANRPIDQQALTEKLARIYLEPRAVEQKKTYPAALAPKASMLAALAGHYQGKRGPMITLQDTGSGKLGARTASGDRGALSFWADGTFGQGDYDGLLYRPVHDRAGKVAALEEIQPGGSGLRVVGRLERVTPAQLTDEALAALAGSYRGEEIDTTYELSVESGQLTLRSLYLPQPQVLVPTAPDRFELPRGPLAGLILAVERGADGKPTALLADLYRLRGLRLTRIPAN